MTRLNGKSAQLDEDYVYDSWVDELTLRQKARLQMELTAEEEES